MIHGIENGLGWISSLHRAMDWTDGCVAVTDPEIEEIRAATEHPLKFAAEGHSY